MNQSTTNTILVLLVALVNSGIIGAAVLAFRKWAIAKWGVERIAAVTALATEAVRAAEQMGGWHDLGGEQKYDLAAKALGQLAAGHGLTIDTQQTRVLIESAVHQLTQSQQQLDNATPASPPVDVDPAPVPMTAGEQKLAPVVRHFSGKAL